jgi:predicted PurR-regulated permease PerM
MAVSASSASDDIATSMQALASVIDQLAAEVDVLAASMDNLAASSGTASAGVAQTGASADAASFEVMTLGDAVDMLTGAVDSLMGSITPLLATLGMLIAVMGAMTIINAVTSWIENLIQQMFQLDQQTQKTVNSWQYLFATVKGGGLEASQSLARWAYAESPKLPFTAMDLRSAISTLGTAGYNPAQIEQFLPYLADIASTLGTAAYGGQGVTLEQAAMAIRSAGFGLTRMLRTDLGISPAQLVPYGLDAKVSAGGQVKIKDMATLLPAIMAFARGRGLAGAAQAQETKTFWGAWSSFQDYVQNWLQTAGGIDPQTGAVEKGSLFGGLQNILIMVNKTLGEAQAAGTGGKGMSLGGLTGVIGNILGGGVSSLTTFVEGFFGGAGAGGAGKVVQDLYEKLKQFGDWLQSAKVQAEIRQIGEEVGKFAGEVLKLAQDALPTMMEGLSMVGQSLKQFWDSLSPTQRRGLEGFVGDIFLVIAALAGLVATFISAVASINAALNKIAATVTSWGKDLGAQFRQWGADFIQMLMQGIESKLGDFGNLLKNKVGGLIQSVLGHSGPTEGPLVGDDQWMVHMMNMFAEGIQRGIPGLSRAAQQAAMVIGNPFHSGGAALGGGVSNTTYGPTSHYGGSTSNTTIYGATQMEMQMMIERALANLDRQGALIGAAPGGRFIFGGH